MKVYLSFEKVPELAGKTKAEREEIVKLLSKLAIKHWEWWVALLVAAISTGVGAWLGGTGLSGALGAGVGGAIGGLVYQVTVIHIARKHYSSTMAKPSAA